MYNKQESLIKQQVREGLLADISKIDVKYSLTLPNTNFFLEKEIIRRFPLSQCICYEKNKKIYEQQLKMDKMENIILNKGNILSFNKNIVYDFVWLDLCNCFTMRTIRNIIVFISTVKFSNNSIFALTMCLNRWSGGAYFYERHYPNYKEEGIIKHLSMHIDGKVTAKSTRYRCTDISAKSAPMSLYTLNINRYDN